MIDHTGHPHPSTPKARALCRANGGTGDITPKPKSVKATVKRTPKLTEERVPRATKKGPVATVKKSTLISRERHEAIMQASDDEDNQVTALASAPVGISEGEYRGFQSQEEKRAVKNYVQAGYGPINAHLRGSHQGNEDTQQQIADLDAVMDRSKLSQDVGVFRGVEAGKALFGDALDGDMTGFKWREKAFSSTTVNEDVADDFVLGDDDDDDDFDSDDDGGSETGSGFIKMRIVLPKGTKAIEGSGVDLEAEFIVARDSDFQVIRDRGVDPSGVRILDVQLMAQGGNDVA